MTRSKLLILALFGALLASACALAVGSAMGKSLQERLGATQDKLSHVKAHAGVLTTRISHESAQLDQLTAEVADLRNKEATVAAELAQKQAELEQAQARLDHLKKRLGEAIQVLEQRLVAIYESNEPDLITVLLQSHGFDDLLARTQYMRALQDQDNDIVARVRGLRNAMEVTVNTVRTARDQIAAHKQELEATRLRLRQRTEELATARRQQHATLMQVRKQQDHLEGDVSNISEKIAEQLAQQAGVLPAGPIRPGAHGLIWPVNGPVVSGFGPRLGQLPRGDRHSGPDRDVDPRSRVGIRLDRRVRRRVRELHLRRPRRRALDLLRASGADPGLGWPGSGASAGDRRLGLHRPLPRSARPLRGPSERAGG